LNHQEVYVTTITTIFTKQHHRCDELFADAEAAVADKNWEQAERLFTAFAQAMECHFGNEEQILFPAFENKTGMASGPTGVMKYEHKQIRGLIGEMKDDIGQKNAEHYLGISETLLILMQQHNAKEEHMLYDMCDNSLGDAAEQVLKSMKEI
jgi:hemerythrin-like domain-containing protein